MRALVIFYSVTGTTGRVADAVTEGLRDAGADVRQHDLRDGPPPDPRTFDCLGVGFPVHWYRMPEPVAEAVRSFGDLGGLPAFIFILNATYRGAALNKVRTMLVRSHAREIGIFTCHGEGRFLGYTRLGHQFSPGHPDSADLRAAREFGRMLVPQYEAVREGARVKRAPSDPHTHWVYALERSLVTPWLARRVYARFLRLDPSRCSRCGKCARVCPSHNIRWERGATPVWGRDCVLCLTCAEVCPESAVSTPIDWAIFRPFLRYNVARAAHDHSLGHAHVQLDRGHVVRVEAAARPRAGGGGSGDKNRDSHPRAGAGAGA